ncbi:MAG: GGDEF domain-containing protein, partial [Psychrobacter sp.]|nr:GGDEF domain-containing protein [Psychrobacter sp.]
MTAFTPMPLADKQQLLVKLCEQFEDAIFILDKNLRYLSVNATYELMLGYTEDFLLGRPLGIYATKFLSEEESAILKDITNCLDSTGFYESNFSMPNRYGQILECHMTYRKICIEDSVYYIGMVRDMSSAVKDQKQVAHLLNYDQLTGLPNRKVFLSQASDLLLDSSQKVVIVRLNI